MRKILLLLGMLLVSGLCFASALSVEEAVEAAKSWDGDYALALRQYRNAVSITNGENSLTPNLSVSGNLGSGESLWSTQSGWDPSWSGITASVGIAASFSLSPSSLNERKTKELENESAYLTLKTAENTLESSVISIYFSIAQARDSIALEERNRLDSERQKQAVSERYEAGLASELELVQAENSVNAAAYTLDNCKSSYSLLLKSFENLTGLDVTDVELSDAGEYMIEDILSADELFERYAGSAPRIRALDLAARTAELSYDSLKKSSALPSVNVSASYTVNAGVQSRSASGRTNSASDTLSVTAGVSLPLSSYIPSSSQKANLKTAENASSDAAAKLRNSLSELRETIESSTEKIKMLSLQISNQEKTIAALEKEYSLTQEAYYAGEATLTTLQAAEKSVLSASYSLLSLKYTYIQSLYTLSQTLGVSYTDLK